MSAGSARRLSAAAAAVLCGPSPRHVRSVTRMLCRRRTVGVLSSRPSSSSASSHRPPPPFPTVPTCPAATCACEPMPDLPADLPLDRKTPLSGLIAAYSEQVLVCTGKDDWPSRIEDDSSGDNLAADLKELFGRGGVYSDPYHHVAVLNASFPSSVPPRAELQSSSVYLLPSFTYVPFLPRVSFDSVEALAKGFLLPERLHPAHDGRLSPIHRDRLTRHAAYRGLLYGVREPIPDVLVLVCGHGGRDARCGLVGPVLRAAFERELARVGVAVQQGPVVIEEAEEARQRLENPDAPPVDLESPPAAAPPRGTTARVGLISHIGGHKFAGNVIVYLPPQLRAPDGLAPHPLAGYGVWYGRVEPQHVEGLVQETILRGAVVEDHFRGAINRDREIIRL